MWVLGFILLPIAFAAPSEWKINNYVVNIHETTLTSVSTTVDSPSDQLDLTRLGLRYVANNAFNELPHLKNLTLASNSLMDLPEFVFANLTNLEHLSLADNRISAFVPNTFVGLSNLKILNILNNPINSLKKSCFFGLSKSSDILTVGNELDMLQNELFEDPKIPSDDTIRQRIVNIFEEYKHLTDYPFIPSYDGEFNLCHNSGEKWEKKEIFNGQSSMDEDLRQRICIQEGTVKLLDIVKDNETLASDCHKVHFGDWETMLSFSFKGISSFERGWYRIQNVPVWSISFLNNDISRVSMELLNDLPKEITQVELAMNKIEHFDRGIENEHLKILRLSNNIISDIEAGALQKTNLTTLDLGSNRLNNTNFAATLPSTLIKLLLDHNQITELSHNSFYKLNNIEVLVLEYNNIIEVTNQSFLGLSSLQILSLKNNQLRKIIPGAFQNLNNLRSLVLTGNKIKHIEKRYFPEGLVFLYLGDNVIGNLEAGNFVNLPNLVMLSLPRNNISKIEKGSFDLPALGVLNLMVNSLEEIDGESFEGLGKLRYLWLHFNRINNIEKGAMKNLRSLYCLGLNKNPIRKLKNGAFYGLSKTGGGRINLGAVPVELIQAGLFEDV